MSMNTQLMAHDEVRQVSAWSPLSQPLFRALWIASVASNVGTWMQNVGAEWLMTNLAPTPFMVALMQTAESAPLFLLALPAGALADIVDRRRLLLVTQSWMLAAAALALLTLMGVVNSWLLLILTFALGLGAALNAPVWQAVIPELVSREELPSAVSLNSVAFNIARAVGPALGGFIVAAIGSWAVFLLNAASFLGVLSVLYRWQRARRESVWPTERVVGAMRAGLRYVRYAPELRAVLVRTAVFISCGSALWAMLPLLARRELGLGAVGYGVLLGGLGAGAVLAAFILPKVRQKISIDLMIACMIFLFAIVNLTLAYLRIFWLLFCAMIAGGVAWMTIMSSFNIAVQSVVPSWVRARRLLACLLWRHGGWKRFLGYGGDAYWNSARLVVRSVGARSWHECNDLLSLARRREFRP